MIASFNDCFYNSASKSKNQKFLRNRPKIIFTHMLTLALPFWGKRINQYIKQYTLPPHTPCLPSLFACEKNNKLDLLRLSFFLFPFFFFCGAKYESIYCENVRETEKSPP